MLDIKNLTVKLTDTEKELLKGVTLTVETGKVHVLMGPNGSGKSTLAQTLMGHPGYTVTGGTVQFDGHNLLDQDVTQRSLNGMFLSFQYPSEVSGVTISNFLRMVYNKRKDIPLSPVKFRELLKAKMKIVDISEEFASRYLNEGFSGGEKKRMEILQMLVLEPKLAILDETDSGLDIDALKTVAKGVVLLKEHTGMTILLITHYARILQYIKPDFVHIMQGGVITESGGINLAHKLEAKGYAPLEE